MNRATTNISDLGLAAALVTCGHEIHETTREIDGRTHFVFMDTGELHRDVNAYWSDTLNLRARKFFDNTKMLKGRIYAQG